MYSEERFVIVTTKAWGKKKKKKCKHQVTSGEQGEEFFAKEIEQRNE